MKKFSKLLAVVVAIAVIVCPMMSIVSHATSAGGYKIEALDENNLKLTISSEDGFIAYSASVGFNSASAFQSTYSSDGYTNGLKLIDYTTKTATKNGYNTPQISANAIDSSLNVVVMPTDINNLDLLTEVVIGIRVAANSTASLTKIQAADDGADLAEDPTLLTFPAAGSDGVIDTESEDYNPENATTVHTHDLTLVPAVAATCTVAGNSAYYTCSGCDKIFSDSEGTNETTLQAVTIAATGHTVVNDAAVAPTCTETGLTAGSHCSVCNEVLVAQTVVPATGHTVVNDAAVAPTCTETGLTAGSHCSVCGEVIVAQTVVPATEHTVVDDAAVAPTCTETGLTAGSHCSVCGEVLVAQTVVPATGHTVVDDAAVAPTCTETGLTAGSHCSVCNEVIVAQTVVPATGHSFTYTENGDGTHTVGCANGCGYSATEDCDTEGEDGACSMCGYKAAGPIVSVLDENILTNLAPQISITETINVNFRVAKATTTGNSAYASVKMVITATKYNASNMRYLADPVYADLWSLTTKNNAATYYDVATYELDLPIYAYVACYNEDGVEIAHSNTFTAYPSELLKGLYTATPTNAEQEATNRLITDALNLGAAAQAYFAGQVSGDTDLKAATAMNEGWDQSYATAELTGLNNVSNFDWNSESSVTSSTNNITTAADISGAPAISYAILKATATGANPLDYSKLTMEISYNTLYANDGNAGLISDTIEGSEWSDYAVGKNLRYSFKKAAMYDSDKTVTAVVTYDGTRVCTVTYSMDSYISAYKDNATVGGIVTAIGKFTATARNYFAVKTGKTV